MILLQVGAQFTLLIAPITFDDLWPEAITPKFKLDRSYKDNLEARHIG